MGGFVKKIGQSVGAYLGLTESAADKQDRESAQAALESQLASQQAAAAADQASAKVRQDALAAEIATRTAAQKAAVEERRTRLLKGRIGLLGFGETGFTGLLGG